MQHCKICSGKTAALFQKTVLHKYTVTYFICCNCHFVQTEHPYWLEEAYKSAMADTDTGIFVRNLKQRFIMTLLLRLLFKNNDRFVDYGAGYGIFVRLMRDKGFTYFWQDKYAENLFAKNYTAKLPESTDSKYSLLSSFEVFEHLSDPESEFQHMLQYSDNIIFTTSLLPSADAGKLTSKYKDWWYWSPESGQHIAFYTEKALKILAQKHNLNFTSNGRNFHFFSRTKKGFWIFSLLRFLYFFKKNQIISRHID
jgi:hypothetical protein